MASLVGAILFLLPITLPISTSHFHFPFPTSISHFHFPISFTTPQVATLCPLPYGCYPLPGTLWLRVCTPSGQCHSCTRFLSCQNRFPMALRCNAPASNSSATAPRPTAPPYLRPMRLLHGRGAGVGWQMMMLVVPGAVPANHRAHFKNVNYL